IQIKRLGWHPDLPDHRDFTYAAPVNVMASLPKSVDLRPKCPPVYDQGQIGSCTANAIAGAIQFDQMNQTLQDFIPSPLFLYYNEGAIEHTIPLDHGAQIRDGIKSVHQLGACPETLWPYADDHPAAEGDPCETCTYAKKPSAAAYTAALKHKVTSYSRI